MHNNNYSHNLWVIWFTLLVGVLLYVIPWPTSIAMLAPNWLLLILIYWHIALPYRAGVITAFIVGIIVDLFIGSILGIHALAFSIISYCAIFRFQLVRNLALWQQSLLIIVLSIIYDMVIFLTELIINHSVTLSFNVFIGCFVNGFMWIWMFLLLRQIRRYFRVS